VGRDCWRNKAIAPYKGAGAARPPSFLALMRIVICPQCWRKPLSSHAKFLRHCKILLFTMGHLDFAGEFSARSIWNNGAVRIK
jgi:hypothetical protein